MKDPRKYKDTRAEKNPYYHMLKNELRDIEILTEFRSNNSAMILRPEDRFKMWEHAERNIGRYPLGYRHYENYESYRLHKPEATIQEYHDESIF